MAADTFWSFCQQSEFTVAEKDHNLIKRVPDFEEKKDF